MGVRNTDPLIGLRQQWLAVASGWGASLEQQLRVFNVLVSSYAAANRHYHDISHIQHMLKLSDEMQYSIDDQQAFYFAIWFHDAIQVQGKDSERLSAQLATQELANLGVPKTIMDKVSNLILATKHHKSRDDNDIALFLDIDLSILSVSRIQYQAYADGCRKEYRIPDFIYRLGRKKFLRSLKERKYIFNTKMFQKSKEKIARSNIEWELTTL
jgi:predicted metal-dependent HD superfamily phosphohydrolase